MYLLCFYALLNLGRRRCLSYLSQNESLCSQSVKPINKIALSVKVLNLWQKQVYCRYIENICKNNTPYDIWHIPLHIRDARNGTRLFTLESSSVQMWLTQRFARPTGNSFIITIIYGKSRSFATSGILLEGLIHEVCQYGSPPENDSKRAVLGDFFCVYSSVMQVQVLQAPFEASVARCCRVLRSVAGCCEVLQNVARCCTRYPMSNNDHIIMTILVTHAIIM